MGQQLLFKRKHRVVPIHGHVYRILGDPRAVSRVEKMFVVKVYCKVETSPIIEMSFYYPWCPGARLDLTVNFRHEHFIDPTNCPWVSEDACIENWSMRSLGQWIVENKVYLLSMLGQKKKGSRLRLCFWVVHEVPEKNEWICESRYMSSSIKVFVYMYFAGLYLPVNPSATTVYTRSAFYPSLRVTLSL